MADEMDFEAVRSLPQMFFDQAGVLADKPFLSVKRDGEWRGQSWNQTADQIKRLAAGLKRLGLAAGDRVVIVSENRPNWLVADLAVMCAGGITTPAYTTNTVADHCHILTDSGAKIAIVSTKALAVRLIEAADKSPQMQTVIVMDQAALEIESGVRLIGWDALLAEHEGAAEPDLGGIERKNPACIIYTSGTSGKPKGVVLSHGAILCNCMGAYEFLKKIPGFKLGRESFLSFLPLSHSYEHTCGQFLPISLGAEIFYAEGLDKLVANMTEVRPTIVPAVPRLYEAIRARIYRGVEQTGGLKEKMFRRTVELGRKAYERPHELSFFENLENMALEKLVREKVRGRFGGSLKAFVSGGAALSYEVGVDFIALGIRILQGYGQTESAPVVSCNPPHDNKLKTVGPPLKGVEVKIADDGEILVRGELVMDGYWNLPEETAETVRDGWLHTGDIGVLDDGGYIQITDRKKDIIVNSGGDNIAPARVEGLLTAEPEIAQAMVHGDKRPHLVGLIVPDADFAASFAKQHGKSAELSELIEDAEFAEAIGAAVDRVNRSLSVIERVRRTILLAEPFGIDNEMMTPTLKLRRHVIRAQYGERLEGLYGS